MQDLQTVMQQLNRSSPTDATMTDSDTAQTLTLDGRTFTVTNGVRTCSTGAGAAPVDAWMAHWLDRLAPSGSNSGTTDPSASSLTGCQAIWTLVSG